MNLKKIASKVLVLILAFVFSFSFVKASQTWSAPVNISNSPDAIGGLSSVAVDNSGTVHAIFCEWLVAGSRDIYYVYKQQGGDWSTPVNVSQSTGECQNSTLLVTPDNTLHAAWEDYTPGKYSIFYSGKPNGSDWSTPVNVSKPDHHEYHPILTASSDGALHMIWWDAENQRYFNYTTLPVGGVWSAPSLIGFGRVIRSKSMAITEDDTLHVVMQAINSTTTYWDIYYYSKPSGDVWSGPTLLSECETSGSPPNCFDPIIAAYGNTLHVTWLEKSGPTSPSDIYHTSKVGAGDWSVPDNVWANPGDSRTIHGGLAVDSFRNAHLVWWDNTTGKDEILYSKLNGGSWSVPINLSNTDVQSIYPVLTVDVSNYLHVLWSDLVSGNRELYYSTTAPQNQQPTANAGLDLVIDEGEQATLDGTGSSDPDGVGDIASYEWDFGDGNTGSGVIAQHTYDDNGIYTITLTVTDSYGETSSDTATVAVSNVAPTADFSVFPNIILSGESSTLTFGNQFDPGVDDTNAGFLYSYDCTNDGIFELLDGSATTLACTYPDSGIYSAKGQIKDKDGGYSYYTVAITVQTPSEAISDLVDLVYSLNLQNGIENSLDAKLDSALNALDDINQNNDVAAINSLYAFINAVEAQRDSKITSAEADELIALAQRIINSL